VGSEMCIRDSPYLSGLAVAIAKSSGARSAFIAYGSELLPRRWAHRLVLAPIIATDIAVCISAHTSDLVRRRSWRGHPHIAVLHPMLRSPWLVSAIPHRRPSTGLRLVSVSRLVEGHKNFEMLIRLCAVLHPLGVVERLTIIGGGPRLGALRKKAAALGLHNVVDLPGYLLPGEVGKIFSSSHVGLLASRDSMAERVFEGFGLVVHELAGAGLPVLAGAAGGTSEALQEPWGYSLDPDDLWAWVEVVERLFNDENRRREMGSAALAWANSIDPLGSARAFARVLIEKRPIEKPNGTSDDPHPSFSLGLPQR